MTLMPLTRNALAPGVFALVTLAALALGWRDWQRLATRSPATIAGPNLELRNETTQTAVDPRPILERLAPFGSPEADANTKAATPPPPTLDEAALPAPQADYQLFGIIEADVQGRARAIIGTADGQQAGYRVGDAMPDGARIHAVRERAVIFDRDGQLERLALPPPDAGDTAPMQGYAPGRLPGGGPGMRPPARFARPAPPPMPPTPQIPDMTMPEVPMAPTDVPPPVEAMPPEPVPEPQ